MIVMLDAGPLGLATNPNLSPEATRCNEWIEGLIAARIEVAVPEIADYEVRRELLRGDKRRGLRRLDSTRDVLLFVPLTSEVMLQAAGFWARARRAGKPTADPKELDGDSILAAQAVVLSRQFGDEVVVATTNPGHLSLFVDARIWHEIPAG